MKAFKRFAGIIAILLFILQSAECQGIKNSAISRSTYNWDNEILAKALDARLVQWKNDPVVNTEYTGFGVLNSGKALNYLALIAFHDTKDQHPEVAAKVVEQLRFNVV